MTKKPTRQAVAAKGRSGKLAVSGRLKIALDAMLDGSCRKDAAKTAQMADHSLREALKKPHVKRYYFDGLQVLRTSERARNISALVEIRDKSANAMARVSAIKTLEQITDEGDRAPPGLVTEPGIVIQIINAPAPTKTQGLTIDVTPAPGSNRGSNELADE